MIFRVLAWVLLGTPTLAFSHAFGEPVQLPMPYELYIWGATAALILSFIFLAFAGRRAGRSAPFLYLPWLSTRSETLAIQHRIGSAFWLLALTFCVFTGVLGTSDSHRNLNMTFFWILFVLGGGYASMFVGDWYRKQNPWAILMPNNWGGVAKYPRWLGHWPAAIQLVGLITLELFLHSNPVSLAAVITVYAVINLFAMYLWGARRWLQRGELFAVLFRFFAVCSPLRRSPDAGGLYRWRLTLPFADLTRLRLWTFSQLFFVFFLLSSTAFDGLRETKVYFNVFWADPFGILTQFFGEHPLKIYPTVRPWFIAYEFLLLLISPFFYFALFWVFVWLGKVLVGQKQSLGELMRKYLPSLVPIAVVYHLTHYYTLLLSQGVKIRGLVSDPFGWNWNLFGTAITGRLPWLPDMASIWASQVALILLGHVAAVWLAHHQALKLNKSVARASFSQLPMLFLMVIFTGFGLWVLAQPLKG